MTTRRFRKSKLDAYIDIVGVKPDKQVAELAGVTPENVRTFRARRNIPAGWRGEVVEPVAVAAAIPAPPAPPKKKARKKKRKQRASKLDPFLHLLGQMADREIAKLADVTPQNVRAYRKRRDIPALWRDGSVAAIATPAPKAARAPKAAKAPKVAKVAKAPKAAKAPPAPKAARFAPPARPAPKAAPAPAPVPERVPRSARASRVVAGPPATGFGWRLVVETGEDRTEYVTFGQTMLDAVQRGTSELARTGKAAEIIEVHQIAAVL